MKLLIIALLFSVCAQAQDKFYYSSTEHEWFVKIDALGFPTSVDRILYTRKISNDTEYKEWIKRYPDGYEVYCDPCKIKINDHEAKEQGWAIPHDRGTAVSLSMPHWLVDTIVTKIDTIPVLMFMVDTCSLTAPTFTIKGWLVTEGGFQKAPLNIKKERFTNAYMRSIGRLAGEGCYQVFNYVAR